MIPMEIFTVAGTALIGGFLKIHSAKMQMDQARWEMATKSETQRQGAIESARKFIPAGGEWTRRLIVIAVMFAVFVFPTLLAYVKPLTPVFYGYSEAGRGFWFFWESMEKMKFYEMRGLVILPIHTHMAAAIGGFYFGAGITKPHR